MAAVAEELELSAALAVSAEPPVVWLAASAPVLAVVVEDSPPPALVVDVALGDAWAAAARTAAARDTSALLAARKWTVPGAAGVMPSDAASGATLFSEENTESSMLS